MIFKYYFLVKYNSQIFNRRRPSKLEKKIVCVLIGLTICKFNKISFHEIPEHNNAVSSAKIEYSQDSNVGKSDMKMLSRIGERHEPCGQPAGMWHSLEY